MAQVQVVGFKMLGKLTDTAEACDVVPHDDGRHTEANAASSPERVEGLQIPQNKAEIAADLDFPVVFVELINGDPDPRDAGMQQFLNFLSGEQRSVCDKLCRFPAR